MENYPGSSMPIPHLIQCPIQNRSERELSAKSMNYVRNSVKVIVDAYTGDIRYYIVDPDDPVIQTYEKMFPSLFRPVDDIPDDLRSHLRYPHGLFNIQAEIYGIYHMTDPRVFYNREDACYS